MNKKTLLGIALLVSLFVGIYAFFARNHSPSTGPSQNYAPASQHITGNNGSRVNFTVYGDFECPACVAYEPMLKQLREKYKNQIAFQFRHFPLTAIHKNALSASIAAEASGLQGKFWEMHDLLYARHDEWAKSANPNVLYEAYATQLGLSVDIFRADIASQKVKDTVYADIRAGKDLQVTGTPSFFLNEVAYADSAQTLESISASIDKALEAR